MASLKEVKNRMASVQTTRKITSAMKMVASSKLHGAQRAISQMRPYADLLRGTMARFLATLGDDAVSPLAERRELKKATLLLFTSNSSLCGAFNSNAVRAFQKRVKDLQTEQVELVKVITIGSKGADAVRKMKLSCPVEDYSHSLDHASYAVLQQLAAVLMDDFLAHRVDAVELVYHHFQSTARQVLKNEELLPLSMDAEASQTSDVENKKAVGNSQLDYIVEPSPAAVVEALVPKAVTLQLFAALLDSQASEHAARVVAMQIATDNADELLRQLKLTYNKTRQQAITTELLDISVGAMQ